MPDFELWADYDHNGRLTGSQSEYDARRTAPGVVLVANVDADTRAFPSAVSAGSRVRLDYERYSPSGRDDEFAPITVKFNNLAAAAGRSFFFRVDGINGVRTSFFDSTGRILTTRVNGTVNDHPFLTPTGPQAEFTLQSRTFPGSPFGFATTTATTYDPSTDTVEQSQFTLQLVSQDAAQNEIVHDSGLITAAPVLFLDNGMNAVRIYMCDRPENLASLTDVREAVRGIGGLSLVTVPADASGSDTWLQDQFQPGIVVGGDTWRHVIVHMPRTKSDAISRSRPDNLANFVKSHFPAHNVGLMNDFWDRTISFSDSSGVTKVVGVFDAADLGNRMNDVRTMMRHLDSISSAVDHLEHRSAEELSWSEGLTGLESMLTVVRMRIDGATAPELLKAFERRRADAAETRVRQLRAAFPENSAQDGFTLRIGTDTIDVPTETLDRLFDRLIQLQSGANYGGNIESAPPSPGAPLGTIVIGNTTGEVDHMDPDVRRFFYKQRQPVFEINSSWLDVGHVDEVLTFVPDRGGSGQDFAALMASSGLAMALVREAFWTYQAGLPFGHPNRDTPTLSPIGSRLFDDGTSPLTRLMRGKVWPQSVVAAPGSSQLPVFLDPPRIYQALARRYNGGEVGTTTPPTQSPTHGIDFLPATGASRFYPADISAFELMIMERDNDQFSTSDYIQSQYLDPIFTAVDGYFDGIRIFPLPVVFDRVADLAAWHEHPRDFATSAFTPDVVNMQVLNGHLLVPRPYGPRMRADDVTSVITAVLADYDWGPSLSRNLSTRFYQRHHLDVTTAWVERHDRSYVEDSPQGTLQTLSNGIRNLTDVAEAFRDGFPGVTPAEVQNRIRRSNPRNFTPTDDLRDGWRKFTLQEDMVDIFEAYVQLVADALGLTLHFVDSWFYHVHFGGIHCGTNVLREPARGQIPPWWN